MGSPYDDDIWEAVPPGAAPAGPDLVPFVRALAPVGDALDLGCGDGRLAVELRAARITAADVSGLALERAEHRLAPRRQSGAVRLVELTPDAPLPLEDSAFDLVLCAETLEHVRDVQLFLSEARRVLRPGGTLAVTTPAHSRATAARALAAGWERVLDPLSPHLRFFSGRSLRWVLEEMGFVVESLRRERETLFAVARR